MTAASLPGTTRLGLPAEPSSTRAHPGEVHAGANGFAGLAGLPQATLDALPGAVYLCAADGRVVRFNEKAAELWGRRPDPADPNIRYCGSLRLYRTDGTLVPHDQCPMAAALRTGQSFQGEEVVIERPDGRQLTARVNIAPLMDERGRVNGAINFFQDVTDRKQAEARQAQLIQELNHRVKNTLATVQSMAASTARSATSIEEFTANFEARLQAFSKTHALLGAGQWTSVGLHELLHQQIEPFAERENSRVRLEGPRVDLPARQALDLSMLFHEMATNAVKYGALSVSGGQLSIGWELDTNPDGDRVLALQWEESGGPPVATPRQTGFGTRLIKAIASGLRGEANLQFDRSGLRFTARFPLHS